MKIACLIFGLLGLLFPIHYSHSNELKIGTYNIWYGLDGGGTLKLGERETSADREERYKKVFHSFGEMRLDLLAIQELNFSGVSSEIPKIENSDSFHQFYLTGVRIFGFGIPLNMVVSLSSYLAKPLKPEELGCEKLPGSVSGFSGRWFSFQTDINYYLCFFEFDFQGRRSLFGNTHLAFAIPKGDSFLKGGISSLDSTSKASVERKQVMLEEQIDYLAKRLNELKAKYDLVILAGDLNITQTSEQFKRLLSSTGFTDLFSVEIGPTWDPKENRIAMKGDGSSTYADGTPEKGVDLVTSKYDLSVPRKIDHIIFYSKNGNCRSGSSSRRIFNGDREEILSDHFGVMGTLTCAK